jgi:pimeloyl-ACP methyl ester carboxylesterase
MIKEVIIDGTAIACWVNDGGFVAGRKGIVFVHGSGGDHGVWRSQCGTLSGEFNVAAVDLPGHGLSGGAGEDDVSRYVEWVKKFIGTIGLVKPVLAGHSLGAAISLDFAVRHGGLLSAIVPVGGGCEMPVNKAIFEGLRDNAAATIDMILKFAVSKPNREAVTPALKDALLRIKPDLLSGDLKACDRLALAEDLSKIALPSLFICGDDDKMTPPDLSRFLAEKIAGAKLALIEGAGHYVMLEKADAFNSVLAEFVRGLP